MYQYRLKYTGIVHPSTGLSTTPIDRAMCNATDNIYELKVISRKGKGLVAIMDSLFFNFLLTSVNWMVKSH